MRVLTVIESGGQDGFTIMGVLGHGYSKLVAPGQLRECIVAKVALPPVAAN